VFIVGHSRAEPTRQIFPIGKVGEVSPREANSEPESGEASTLEATYGKTKSLSNMVYDGHHHQFTKKMGTLTGRENRQGTNWLVASAVDCDGYLRSGARPRDENGKPQLLPIGYRRIRRLTPTECERLQGFPDGWTEGVSDTQRYKVLGNAVTTNVVEFLGQNLLGVGV
jgi:site-specific DNA-cytosine methylase